MKRVRHRKSKAAAPKRKNYGLSRVPHTHGHSHTHSTFHTPHSWLIRTPFFCVWGGGEPGQLLGKQLEDFSCWIRTCFTLVRVRACLCKSIHVCACVRLSKLTVTRSHLANFHVVNNASLCPLKCGALGKMLWISCSVCKLCNYNQFCAKLANKFWSNNCTHSPHSATPPRPNAPLGRLAKAFGWPKAQTSFHELAMKSN